MESIKSQHHLACSCSYETMASSGEVLNKTNVKKADLVLGRNDYGALVLLLNGGKLKEVYLLNSFTVHKKFLNEGKASITFPLQRVRIMIFNSPPESLFEFLKLIYVKNEVGVVGKVARQQSLMALTFNHVSPLTARDINVINNKNNNNITNNPSHTNNILTTSVTSKNNNNKENNLNNNKLKNSHISKNIGDRVKRKADHTPNNKQNTPPLKGSPQGPRESIKPKAKRQLQMNNSCVLSAEQTGILEAVRGGRNLFITGSAGTGKSYILNKIITSSPPNSTFVTASTGLAASHIKGTTIHSFAGIGTGKGDAEECVRMAMRPQVRSQWKLCRLLIIDEVSMIPGAFFDKLETTARLVRKCDKAFGGIQLVVCGDFLQLPPIVRGSEERTYAFQSSAWERCRLQSHQLRQVHRQDDSTFVKLLNRIRLGICTDDMERQLRSTNHHHHNYHGIVATKLCSHTEDVDRINAQQLQKLSSAEKRFDSTDHPSSPSSSTLLNSMCSAPPSLTLKIGAQVMITKNVNVGGGLVNGSRGVVVALQDKTNGGPLVRLLSGMEHAIQVEKWMMVGVGGVQISRKQLPLKLAWALSIHKSQGMTLDCVEMSLGRVFEAGQAYVALSRARKFAGLRVVDFDKRCIRADPDVIRFYKSLVAC